MQGPWRSLLICIYISLCLSHNFIGSVFFLKQKNGSLKTSQIDIFKAGKSPCDLLIRGVTLFCLFFCLNFSFSFSSGLDFSQPWHKSFVQARKQILMNLHILHPTLRTLLDIGYKTFSNLLIVDVSSFR